jgi:rhodanese-related sulfurtransferase
MQSVQRFVPGRKTDVKDSEWICQLVQHGLVRPSFVLPVERVDRMTVEQLHGRWEADRGALQVLDVRERAEWDAGHIPRSVHLPYHDIHGLPGSLDPERPIAAVCASGQRSAVAASVLKRLGARAVVHVVDGGVPLWQRMGWPLEA